MFNFKKRKQEPIDPLLQMEEFYLAQYFNSHPAPQNQVQMPQVPAGQPSYHRHSSPIPQHPQPYHVQLDERLRRIESYLGLG